MLIAAGADVNAKRADGITPMTLADSVKNIDTVAILRKHGGKGQKPQLIQPGQQGHLQGDL